MARRSWSTSRDDALLLDILLAAGDACEFAADVDLAGFSASKLHQCAIIRCLEVIGEAAGKVSREFCDNHSNIPWRDIVGMRHRLIHDYADVRLDIVWDVVRNRRPELIVALRPLVPPDTESG